MLSAITNVAKNGASPLIAKGAMAVVAVLLIAMGLMSWKMYQSQVEITSLTAANTQLQANNQILKGNVKERDLAIAALERDIEGQKRRYESLLETYRRLEAKSKEDEQRAEEFRQRLRDLMRDLESEESKILNTVLPDSIIDLYNHGNRRLRDTEGESGTGASNDNSN